MYRNRYSTYQRREPDRNPDHVHQFYIPGYKDLGWQKNGDEPELIACREAGHKTREHDNSLFRYRATDVITICDECKHLYHTDMSD